MLHHSEIHIYFWIPLSHVCNNTLHVELYRRWDTLLVPLHVYTLHIRRFNHKEHLCTIAN